jgi:cytochrome c biogenesis protein
VVKVPDARPTQLGFAGVFLPTEVAVDGQLQSAFPAALLPRVSLVAYAGNLGMNGPDAQSVYDLDTRQMHPLNVAPRPLAPGQSIKLPDGDGTLTFTGYTQWVSLAITYDPGQLPALVSAVVALLGLILSFLVRRRRFFVRAAAADGGGTEVLLGGLARSDAAGGFETEFADMTAQFRKLHAASQAAEGGTSAPVPSETAITAAADPALAGREGSDS